MKNLLFPMMAFVLLRNETETRPASRAASYSPLVWSLQSNSNVQASKCVSTSKCIAYPIVFLASFKMWQIIESKSSAPF